MKKFLHLFVICISLSSCSREWNNPLDQNKDEESSLPTNGLVAYYPFNGNANDESGKGNHGTVLGPILTSDRFDNPNQAYIFDGVNDYITVNNSSSLNPENQLTICFWIRIDGITNSWSPLLHKGGPFISGSKNREYAVWLNSSRFFHLASAGDGGDQHAFDSSSNHPIDQWIYYVAVIDRINHVVRIYIDGSLDKSYTDSYSSFNNNGNSLRIGSSEETSWAFSPFKGIIDDIRIYNRVLTDFEIESLYHEGGWAK